MLTQSGLNQSASWPEARDKPEQPTGAIGSAIQRVNQIANLLRSSNESLSYTNDRLQGSPNLSGQSGEASALRDVPYGEVAQLMAALGELLDEASRTSNLSGALSSL